MDELNLVAALVRSRQNYELLVRTGLEAADFGEAARVIVDCAGEQFRRDADIQAVDAGILRSQVERRYGAGSMATSVMEFVGTLPPDVSGINAVEEYRLLRLARCSTTLATLLACGKHGEETEQLLDRYKNLVAGEAGGEEVKWRLDWEDFEEDESARVPIGPGSLNRFIGGGVLRGHNITVYGRPDSGKSLFALNCAAFACRNGFSVLYVANEEPAQDITRRLLSRMAGVDIDTLRGRDALQQALEKATATCGYDNWHLFHRAGVTARDIAQQAVKIRPDFVIVDQLKNVHTNEDNRALQLDKLARQVRELGIEQNCVTMSITQAGESAHNKLILTQTDVEWSNTGIPGAADLMIGIGVDDEYLASNKRMISVPKNKVNGRHGSFTTFIAPERTAFLSKPRGNRND